MPNRWVGRTVVGLAVCMGALTSMQASGPGRQGTRGSQKSEGVGPAQKHLSTDVVEGRVMSVEGRPIARAVVSLTDVATGAQSETTRSEPDGHYHFEPLAAGKYRLSAHAKGYIDASYQGHGQFSTAIVLGAGLATNALELRLTPEAIIRGRITDESGDAVPQASVVLFRRIEVGTTPDLNEVEGARATRFRTANTEDSGEFRLDNLPPGSYFLAVSGTPWYATRVPLSREAQRLGYRPSVDPALDVAYPQVFYPGATEPEKAAAIVLKGGERLVENLQLHAERAVSLQVSTTGGSAGTMRFPRLTRTVFGVVEQVQTQVESDGPSVRMTGLVPGRYQVQEQQQGGVVNRGSIEVTGAGTTVDLDRMGQTQQSATVRVRAVSDAQLPTGLELRVRETAGPGRLVVKVGENEKAEIAAINAGTYRVNVLHDGSALPLVQLVVNGSAVPSLRLRVPQRTEKLMVEALVTLQATRVEGYVRREGKPVGGSMVVLVPVNPMAGTDLFRRDQSDLDGSFVLNGVVPGNYLLIAVDEGWSLPWTDVAAMTKYLVGGIPIAVPLSVGAITTVKESLTPQTR